MSSLSQTSRALATAVAAASLSLASESAPAPDRGAAQRSATLDPLTPVRNRETTLKLGKEGQAVEVLNRYLTVLKYPDIPSSGHFTAATEAAVRDFQQRNGLKVDGMVGPATLRVVERAIGDRRESLRPAQPTAVAKATTPEVAPAETAPTNRAGTLKFGSNGPEVRALNRCLAHLGYPTNRESSQFTAETEAAVKQFQRNAGLVTDGKVGNRTIEAVAKAITQTETKRGAGAASHTDTIPGERDRGVNRTLSPGDRGEEVLKIKELLNAVGAKPPLAPSPEFDQLTARAVLDFKRETLQRYPVLAKEYGDTKLSTSVTPLTFSLLEHEASRRSGGIVLEAVDSLRAFFRKDLTRIGIADERTFGVALGLVFESEGGISTDKDDPGNRGGNATNKGVTQKTYDEYCQKRGIESKKTTALTDAEITRFYKDAFWEKARCEQLPECVAIVHFDFAVNGGIGGANAILKRALGFDAATKVPNLHELAKQAEPASLSFAMLDIRREYYRELINENSKLQKYARGWNNRCDVLAFNIRIQLPGLIAGSFEDRLARPMVDMRELSRISIDRDVISSMQSKYGMERTGELNDELLDKILSKNKR